MADIGGGNGMSNNRGAPGQGIRPSTTSGTYEVYGDLELPGDITISGGVTVTIPSGSTLTVPSDTTLTVDGTLDVDGTLTNNGSVSGDGSLTGDGTVTNNGGTINVDSNSFAANVSLSIASGGSTVSSATYGSTVTLTATVTSGDNQAVTSDTVNFYQGTNTSGTPLNSTPAQVGSNGQSTASIQLTGDNWRPNTAAYTITAVYTPASGSSLLSGSGTATLTVTLPNADIDLTVKNGDDTTNEFTYSDTITIEGTVQAASNVNTNDLSQNQVGLFLGDDQLGNTVTVSNDGSFTLTYDTAGKAIAATGQPQTLTVQYGGSSALNSGSETVQITLNPKPVTAQVASGTTITKVYDGTTSITASLSIPADALVNANDNVTVSASGTFAQPNVGDNISITFTSVTPSGTDAAYYSVSGPTGVTGSITAAQSSVTTPPTAVQNLTYTGADQTLVTAGVASGGTMVYALGSNSSTAPTEGYSATIPTGTNAGTYYVWYKVQGDSNHSDITPLCVEVTIAKKELTVSAVTAEDKTYDGTTSTTGTVTLLGAVNNEQPTATGTFAFESADAGNGKTVNVTNIALTGTWSTNYTLSATTATGTATISPLTATLVWSGYENLTYTGSPVNVTATVGNLVAGDTCTVTVTGGTETYVGQYIATSTGLSNSNYALPSVGTSQTYSISAASAAVGTPPTANTGLTYTGGGHALVTAGTTTDGTLVYALGNDADTAPESSSFSAAIPQGTDAGTYYVWYKVQGDSNHNDTEPVCVTVDIGKASQDTPAANEGYTIDYWAETISALDGYELSATADAESGTSSLTAIPGTTVYVRLAETGTHTPSPWTAVTIPARLAAPEGITGGTRVISGVDTTMEYSSDGGSTWTTFTEETVARIDAGTYLVRLAATGAAFASQPTDEITVRNPSGGATYPPSVTDTENGTVALSPATPIWGQTVTITPEPADGFEVDQITVTDRNGAPISVIDNGDGTWSFTQPSGRVTITVTFREVTAELPFTDVSGGAWYEDAVRFVYENGLMTGTDATTFSPAAETSRGMIAAILWRLEGEPAAGESGFTDVAAHQYYATAIAWAEENGIVNGTSDTTYSPDAPVTREQLAAILYRYAAYKGYDVTISADLSAFADAGEISGYAADALAWANAAGIVNGTSGTTLDPQGSAIRAQVAAMLMRFCVNAAQ